MKFYAERRGGNAPLSFLFHGRRIEESDTPDDLELENEDVIDAFLVQSGDIGVFELCDATRSDHGILVGMASNIAPPAEAVRSIATQPSSERNSGRSECPACPTA
jgi:hypothetical protein